MIQRWKDARTVPDLMRWMPGAGRFPDVDEVLMMGPEAAVLACAAADVSDSTDGLGKWGS